MNARHLHGFPGLPSVGRRGFLGAVGISALSLESEVLNFASSLFADEPRPATKPRIQVVFLRPEEDRYWMSWPGASYDVEGNQQQYTKTLIQAARKQGVDLEIRPLAVHEPDDVGALAERIRQAPPDGLFVNLMHLKSWPRLVYLLKNRGEVPTVVFSPLGTGFAKELAPVRGLSGTFIASTQDPEWPAFGLRMLKSAFALKRARLCMVAGKATEERPIKSVGTTLRYVPLARWTRELAEADTTDEMQTVADYYAKEAEKIIEPKKEDLFAAAKNYVVARRIMAAEKCQGISVDCQTLLNERRVACGMCVAWSRLLDEGMVGTCEADPDAAVSMLMAASLLERPGFMQDPVPNTVGDTLIGAHCTCATRLQGFDKPHAPFVLRSQAESASGVGLQVRWSPDQDITIMKFQAPDTIAMGTGRVVGSVEGAGATACRTAVEVKLDGAIDPRKVNGHHQLFVCGKWDGPLKAFAELTGLKTVSI